MYNEFLLLNTDNILH